MSLRIGAKGWDHPGWQDTFYPDDLPPDWRLPYYANEFTTVLVPKEAWTRTEPQTVTAWLEDVDEDFLLFWEAPGPATDSDFRDLEALLSPLKTHPGQIGGVLLKPPPLPIQKIDELRQILQPFAAIIVPGDDCAWPEESLLERLDASVCWRPGLEWNARPERSVALGIMEAAHACSPKELRSSLESFTDYAAHSPHKALVFEGSPPPVDIMRNASIIADLMA